MKLKKGSKEAKAFMAKLRAARGKKKKVGAIKIVEKGETKATKPKATYQTKRTKKGTFKGLRRIGATKTHKDTKSHNVNIRMVSGIGAIKSDLNRKLTSAQNNLAELVGKLAATKEMVRLTKSATAKNQLPVLRKKITEAKKVVTLLKKASK